MIEVEHAPLRRIQLNTVRGVVKFLHRALNFGFDLRVLRLVIKRPVFKDDVFPFGHVHELKRHGDFPGVIRGQTDADTVTVRVQDDDQVSTEDAKLEQGKEYLLFLYQQSTVYKGLHRVGI